MSSSPLVRVGRGQGLRERMERGHAPHVHVTVSKATEGGKAGWRKEALEKRGYRRLWDPGGGGEAAGAGFSICFSSRCRCKKLRGGPVLLIQQTLIELELCLAPRLGAGLWLLGIRTLPPHPSL